MQPSQAGRNMGDVKPGGQKKPYSKPEFVVYGTIQKITKSNSNRGNTDGAHGMSHKTILQ